METKPFLAGYRGVRTLVLGASGFIGRWVARGLEAQEARVYLVVRDRAMADKTLSRHGIHGEIIQVDLSDFRAIDELFQHIRPSITFNLAGYGIDPMERDERIAIRINTHLVGALGTSLAINRDPTWSGHDIVHVGSAQEYGTIRGNLAEDSIPNPTTIYGKSKLAGTILLRELCRRHRLKGVTARLFTVYGPGEHAGRLLPSLLETARTASQLPLTTGTQRRDFTYVEDAAEGLLRLGLTVAGPCAIVNLATGKLTSVREFAMIAAEVLQISTERLGFGDLPTRPDEMEHSKVSVQALKDWLNWVPAVDILEGITRTAAFEGIAHVTSA